MPEAQFTIGDEFRTQFVWRLPSDDFLRAIFRVQVLKVDSLSDKYVVRLEKFEAGRQESPDGLVRQKEEVNRTYWSFVDSLTGKMISLAYEADDGRPLWLRLETLTGEHNFFHRLSKLPPSFTSWQTKRARE